MELESRRQELAAQGLGLAALSPDTVARLHDFARRRAIGFPLLSDADSTVIRAFGVLNEEIAPGEPNHGIPHPGMLVVDARGIVRKREFATGYAERPTVASLLDMEAGAPVTRIETPGGITVALSASDTTVMMGRRLTLRAEIAIPQDAHLYAPGADGYTALALELDEHPVIVPRKVRLPRSRILKFKGTGERLPVFDGPTVKLAMDAVVADARPFMEWLATKPTDLVLTGRLAFQSCSSTACQPPASVPVTWTFQPAAPDFERSPEELRPAAASDTKAN